MSYAAAEPFAIDPITVVIEVASSVWQQFKAVVSASAQAISGRVQPMIDRTNLKEMTIISPVMPTAGATIIRERRLNHIAITLIAFAVFSVGVGAWVPDKLFNALVPLSLTSIFAFWAMVRRGK